MANGMMKEVAKETSIGRTMVFQEILFKPDIELRVVMMAAITTNPSRPTKSSALIV